MKRYLPIIRLTLLMPLICFVELPKVIWTATFANAMPNRDGVSQEYCQNHSPDQYTITTKYFIKEGVKANNGIMIKGLTSNDYQKYGIFLHNGDAFLEGNDNGKPWQSKMHFYSHSLTLTGPGQGIWADKDCKGTFIFTGTRPSTH